MDFIFFINVSFLLFLNFHSKGFELVKKKFCNNELKKNWTKKAFVITFSFYILCTLLSFTFHTRSFFNEVIRKNDVNAFYPYNDHNSVESFASLATVTFIISPGEHLCTMYCSYICIVLYSKYKHFKEELQISTGTNSLRRDSDIEEERQKYNHLQNIISDFNSTHSFIMVFNITTWILMMCTLSYVVITSRVDGDVVNKYLILLIMNIFIMLFVQLFVASMLYSEVSGFL